MRYLFETPKHLISLQQEKRIKVTIRYSAEAGLRPFYLTVAHQIKSAYPDVLLEKRILPPVGSSDAGGDEVIFEVDVDGKAVVGKKKTKMLMVSSRDGKKGKNGRKGEGSKASSDTNAPDIAGGRAIFVSMEKLDHELSKARKRRRPNTTYKSKEDALRGAMASGAGGDATILTAPTAADGMTEAVLRLDKLKAMSRTKI